MLPEPGLTRALSPGWWRATHQPFMRSWLLCVHLTYHTNDRFCVADLGTLQPPKMVRPQKKKGGPYQPLHFPFPPCPHGSVSTSAGGFPFTTATHTGAHQCTTIRHATRHSAMAQCGKTPPRAVCGVGLDENYYGTLFWGALLFCRFWSRRKRETSDLNKMVMLTFSGSQKKTYTVILLVPILSDWDTLSCSGPAYGLLWAYLGPIRGMSRLA